MKHPMRSHAKVRHALSGILSAMPRFVDNLPLPAPHVESHAGMSADVPDDESIELIIDNVRLVDDREKLVSVAVSGGVIRDVRSPDEIRSLGDERTTRLDGGGNLLLPDFCDSHVHLLVGAERLDGCDLEGAATLDEVAARLRDFIRAHPHRPPALTRHAEARRGKIKPGMAADLVLLHTAELSAQARVQATISKGKIVHDAEQSHRSQTGL